jgi:predicted ATPase
MGRPLVGRDSELAMLARLITEAAAGHGSCVLIEGEPGIGKSALVRAAIAETMDLDCQQLLGQRGGDIRARAGRLLAA